MSLGILQFQPQLIPSILVVVLVSVFIALGLWQLDRAGEKRELGKRLNDRISLPAINLSDTDATAEALEYRSIIAQGVFVAERTIFIENRKHRGKSGFHVITPLRLDDGGRYLLINRGWIEANRDHRSPEVETPEHRVTIRGQARIPLPPALELEQDLAQQVRTWPYLTLDRYRHWSGLNLVPFVLLQTDDDQSAFIRSWPRPTTEDGMHIGYAIQWFAFALIALAVWLKLSLVRQQPELPA